MQRRASHVFKVLSKPHLVAGVEFTMLAVNGLFAMIFVVALHFWYWIPAAYLIHKILQAATRNDPLMRPMFITFSRQSDVYVPWPSATNLRGQRPRNFGRGDLW
ncbi:MAG TPA: VirB3 family type IV secretion system protein [Nevskiaceae bacterium]|nr:VirB3 family type IV secretion system protein [Nevskiaceae bacterium]